MFLCNTYKKLLKDNSSLFIQEDYTKEPIGNVIIMSPFGKTTHDNFLIAYYFRLNRFNVYRFDPRNHVGLSSGVMENFSLLQLEEDVLIAFENFTIDKSLPTFILSISISYPVSLKFVSKNPWIKGLISLVPAVNPDDTVSRVIKCDVKRYRTEENLPYYQYGFGCKINARNFIIAIEKAQYSNFTDMIGYVNNIHCPMYIIAADKDEFVDLKDVYQIKQAFINENSELLVLKDVTHDIGTKISSAKQAVSLMVKKTLYYAGYEATDVIESTLKNIMTEIKKESTLLKSIEDKIESSYLKSVI